VIDLHSHILPNMDDGPQSMEEAILMARAAVQQGIKTIVATPHTQNGTFSNSPISVKENAAIFSSHLNQLNIPLTVLPGHEVRVTTNFQNELENGEYLFLDDKRKYILIEFSTLFIPSNAQQLIYNLSCDGIVPIIAHPERNAIFHKDPNSLCTLVEEGALTQITAGSLIGSFGKNIKKFSIQLLKNNLAHIIASDAHDLNKRGFVLDRSYSEIEKLFGKQFKNKLVENAYFILSGNSILKSQPNTISRKAFLGLF
jgi:protein-tyrosine phosphatase